MNSIAILTGAYLASLLDPIAIVVCGTAGALFGRWVYALAAGGLIYIALLALLGALPSGLPLLSRLLAGMTLGLMGYGIKRLVRKKSGQRA